MGGVVFIFATIVATLLTAKLSNFYIVGGLLCLALFSLIGIQDDYSKISKASSSVILRRISLSVSIFVILIRLRH